MHSQAKCNDHDIISTLKAMQAFVPDSPRTSFIAPFSPDLVVEAEDGSYSSRPPHVIEQPQLYPYTLSDDDLWAEQMVANILAVSRSLLPPRWRYLTLFKDHYRTKSV
jgi:hypothetical protein